MINESLNADDTARRGTIMIVDDNADIRWSMSEILSAEGFETVAAENGAEALTWMRSNPLPAMILCDVMMPVMGGREFARRKNEAWTLRSIPLVMISGVMDSEADRESLHAVACLTKPVDIGVLLTVMKHHCPLLGPPDPRSPQFSELAAACS